MSTGYELEVSKNYCHCLLLNLSEKLTLSEFFQLNMDLMEQADGYDSLESASTKILVSNELIKDISIECATIFSANSDISVSNSQISILAEHHLSEIKKEIGLTAYNNLYQAYNLEAYSECYMKKIYKNFTQAEMLNLSEINIKLLEAIQDSCLEKNKR